MNHLKVKLSQAFARWSRWMERQGFYVMVGLCLMIIVGSAIWTRMPSSDTPNESVEVGEAADFQQRLADVMKTLTPEATLSPTATPQPRWVKPVSGDIIRPYSPLDVVYQPTMDAWAIHNAVDIAVIADEPVVSPVAGKVSSIRTDARFGLTVSIKLDDGSILSIMGLKLASVTVYDDINQGQSIGIAGGKLTSEASDPIHIHVYWEKNGKTLDPSLMWD